VVFSEKEDLKMIDEGKQRCHTLHATHMQFADPAARLVLAYFLVLGRFSIGSRAKVWPLTILTMKFPLS
jgi:hypothetical protein